jgi:adenylosuccinate synthase
MPLDIIIGAQWGDEGKGGITDLVAARADIVARFGGGDNAGHTLTIAGEIFKLHLIPSGIVREGIICLIGSGVVVNPAVFLRELDALEARGVDISPDRLKISHNAHLITPAHVALDKALEQERGDEAIGTTQRGIGPAYTDKTSRSGIRAGSLADSEGLGDLIQAHIRAKNEVLTKIYGVAALDATAVAAQYAEYARRMAPYLANGPALLDDALQNGKTVLAEGAQGTFLDLDHGTYPFVTSSSSSAGGALIGLGVGPKMVGRIIGITKAFTSRVGSGPFPTELSGEAAVRLRGTGSKPWDEFGTTTGRPRRVGWLDLVMLDHARRINSLTELVITKLDILSGLEELPVCVGYQLNGEQLKGFPADLKTLALCRPIYETLPGWEEDIMQVKRMSALPANARQYVQFVSETVGVPVSIISVGPGREQVIEV